MLLILNNELLFIYSVILLLQRRQVLTVSDVFFAYSTGNVSQSAYLSFGYLPSGVGTVQKFEVYYPILSSSSMTLLKYSLTQETYDRRERETEMYGCSERVNHICCLCQYYFDRNSCCSGLKTLPLQLFQLAQLLNSYPCKNCLRISLLVSKIKLYITNFVKQNSSSFSSPLNNTFNLQQNK